MLRTNVGLSARALGPSSVERAVSRRSKETGAKDHQEYFTQLQQSTIELQELVEEVIVPETYFFRDAGAFEALARWVRTDWMAKPGAGPLEILSIPCSTGEEPYSIAMTLLDEGLPSDAFVIAAADISERALARARSGLYRIGAFRGPALGYRDRYFENTPDGYVISDRVRECVHFRGGNLAAPQPVGRPFHVVFCRNLLIYFDDAAQRDAMQRLDELVAPAGLLFLGAAETFLALNRGYLPLGAPMSFAFRKLVDVPPVAPVPRASRPSTRRTDYLPPRQATPARAARAAKPAPRVAAPASDEVLVQAEILANRGELVAAAELCNQHLRHSGPDWASLLSVGVGGGCAPGSWRGYLVFPQSPLHGSISRARAAPSCPADAARRG